MYQVVTRDQIKDFLNIEGASQDSFLAGLALRVSSYVENAISRNVVARQVVEYPEAHRANRFFLRNFPVYQIASIYIDSDRLFGADSLLESTEYSFDETGQVTLISFNAAAIRANAIKATYTGGLSRFRVVSGQNDHIDIEHDSTDYEIQLTAGEYIAEDLATEIATQLQENVDGDFSCTYSHIDQRFKIKHSADTFALKWANGANSYRSAGDLIGYAIDQDDDDATEYAADFQRNGAPHDLQLAALKIAYHLYDESKWKGARQGVKLQSINKNNLEFETDYPADAKRIIQSYRGYSF